MPEIRTGSRTDDLFVIMIAKEPPDIPILRSTDPIVIGGPATAPTTITINYQQEITSVGIPKIDDSDGTDIFGAGVISIVNRAGDTDEDPDDTVIITYITSPFRVCREYTLSLPIGFAKKCLAESEEHTFTFNVLDVDAPKVSRLNPAEDEDTANIPTQIVITFDKEIEKSDEATKVLTITNNDDGSAVTVEANRADITVDSSTMELTVPVTLTADTRYTIIMPDGFVKYCSNDPSQGKEWTFCGEFYYEFDHVKHEF